MNLNLTFWDVKHGSATLIRTPNGTSIAYDMGIGRLNEFNEEFSPMKYLQNGKNPLKKLDLVCISHPDEDHISDLINLNFDGTSFRCWERPKLVDDEVRKKYQETSNNKKKAIFQRYLNICGVYTHKLSWEQEPYNPKNNGNVEITPFFPKPEVKDNRVNNHSIILLLSYKGIKILLSGDNEKLSWRWLIENEDDFIESIKDTDIFLASHHGRKSGVCEELLEYLSPKLTIISDGPEGETSDTDSYRRFSDGMIVYNVNNEPKFRYCLTTRKDGAVKVQINNSLNVYSSNN
jgi:competence protein ComEC